MKNILSIKSISLIILLSLLASCNTQPSTVKSDFSTKNTFAKSGNPHNKELPQKNSRIVSGVRHHFKANTCDSLKVKGAVLYVGKNSLAKDQTLSITPLDSTQLPPIPGNMLNVTTNAAGFRFLPHGEHFQQCATVALPYDSLRIPKGYTAKDIRTYYFNEATQMWTRLPLDTIKQKEQLALAYTTHFTDMINGILQVPEASDANGYAPTTLSDIPVANPLAGVVQMGLPQANPNGSANLQLPINIPTGRAGMQPNITVSYSSDGGSGWMGYGWSVSIPTIDIDTRWGVPLFDAEKESESYLFQGEQFTEMAHRDNTISRTKNKRFYLRRETDFSEITRNGNSTKDYSWTVKGQDGSKTEFSAIARDDNGNIVQWGITKVEDIHGNNMTYTYETEGGMAYVSEISYTGFGNEKGVYKVRFVRATEQENTRTDATTNGRLGYLQTDNAQLKSIEIFYKDELLRSYKFNYAQGVFNKTMLTSVTETDGNRKDLYTHTFNYYDDVQGQLFEKNAITATTPGIFNKDSFFKTKRNAYNSQLTMLNGASSSGYSVGGGANVSIGFSKKLSAYVGASYTYNQSSSNVNITLTDINGDGLLDKVFTSIGRMYYCPNISKGNEIKFGVPIAIAGINVISENKMTSNTVSTDAGVTAGIASAGVSYSHTTDNNQTKTYFQDFNGDGLIDIARNGTVYFNRIENGVPTFRATSAGTPNPIASTDLSLLDGAFVVDEAKVRDSLEREFPLHDVVRVWRAPFDGVININAPISLNNESVDGIRFTVQQEKKELHRDNLQKGEQKNIELNDIKVSAGDRIFFRTQSVYSGTNDEVTWMPQITYADAPNGIVEDENGLSTTHYSITEDFLEGEANSMFFTNKTKITLNSEYQKLPTTDDVTLKIIRRDWHTGDSIVYKSLTLEALNQENGVINFEENLNPTDSVEYDFYIETNSQINQKAISWNPVINTFTADGTKDTTYISAARNMYNKIIQLADAYTIETGVNLKEKEAYMSDSIFISLQHVIDLLGDEMVVDVNIKDARIVMKEKGGTPQTLTNIGEKYFAKESEINGKNIYTTLYQGTKDWSTLNLRLNLSRTIVDTLISYNLALKKYDTIIIHTNKTIANIPFSIRDKNDMEQFGHLYRGWGQFAYNGNKEYEGKIDVSVLKTEGDKYNDFKFDTENAPSESEIGFTSIKDTRFFVMGYDAKNEQFVSSTQYAYLSKQVQCPARLGSLEIEVDVPEYPANGGGLAAPILISKTKTNSVGVSAGVSIGKGVSVGAGVNGSYSNAETVTETGVLDLNGDRYPDWLEQNNSNFSAQYTAVSGALSGMKLTQNISLPLQQGHAEVAGVSASASVGEDDGSGQSGEVVASTSQGWYSKEQMKEAAKASKTSGGSLSVSGNYSHNKSQSKNEWMDINGDGLPDMIYDDGNVRYNLGYSFSDKIPFGQTAINISKTNNFGAGMGVSVNLGGQANIGGGSNFTRANTETHFALTDINGDGLPDMYDEGKIFLNTGQNFTKEKIDYEGDNFALSKSTSHSVSANAAFPFTIILVRVTPFVSGVTSNSVSRLFTSLQDINGDGFPDILESESDAIIKIRLNRTGRTNLLKSVTLPLGAEMTIDYERTNCSYESPQSKFVMKNAEIKGGDKANGATRMRQEFSYKDNYYDRYERTSYGFAETTTKQIDTENSDAVYRTVMSTYLNDSYATRSLPISEVTTDSNGNKLTEKQTTYDFREVKNGGIYPAVTQGKTTVYTDNTAQTTTENYTYDEIGNVTRYTSVAGDNVEVSVNYHTGIANRRVPKSVTVEGGATRTRTSEVNAKGDITRLTLANGEQPSVYDMTYDAYGNMTSITRPMNDNGERMRYDYTYDPVLHCLPTSTKNSYGYTSATAYDYKFGVPTETTDINNEKISYLYDKLGRIVQVTAPYEKERGTYTLQMEYHPTEGYALTRRNMTEGIAETYAYADNLGRETGQKQTAEVYGRGRCYVMSGTPVFDAFGRTVKTSLPYIEGTRPAGYAETRYDALDRQTEAILPDGATAKTTYTVENNRLKATQTDPEGHVTDTYTDLRGRTTQTTRHSTSGDVTVKYAFNPLGELLTVTHPNGHTTTYTYDALGRKLSVNHPDAGLTEYTYDAANNLLTKTTPNLRGIKGGSIRYLYDYERLTEVQYPKNIFNRVQYEYGAPGADHHRAGRLVLVQDASGGTEYFYDALGNVTKTIRTIMLTATDVRTYVSESAYDTWGRIRTMVYPDGERVTYGYNTAGNLNAITAEKDGNETAIMTAQGYDHFGNVVYRRNGNGTENSYTYDPLRQRLTSLKASSHGTAFMDCSYSYDKIDNILSIKNTARPQGGDLGGTFQHSYTYDDLSRLISANGTCRDTVNYTLQMTYDIMSNPLQKTQTVTGSDIATSHDLHFAYDHTKPNAVTQIGGSRYTYDRNGNPTLIATDSTHREMTWDEENRMLSLNDDGYVSRYTYDHTGTRTVKSHGPMEAVYVNGAPQGINYHDEENYTVYVSPYLIATADRFTKYYYNGTQRIAAKLGTGEFDNVYGVNNFHLTAGQKDYAERMVQIEESRQEYMKRNGIPPGVPTQKGQNIEPEITGVALPNKPLGNYDVPDGWPTPPHFNEKGDVPGPPLQWEEPEDLSDPEAGYGFVSDNEEENDIFFFHSDHLGSTSYLTDKDGNACEYVVYTPYGEALVNENNTDFENLYKFSGMELDKETGLYNHGARLRDPITANWLKIDPLYEQFPEVSPWVYCHANPTRYTDPTGMFDTEEEANAYHTELGGSAAKIWQAEDGLWHVTMSKDGTDYYRPSKGAEVVKYQSVWAKINTFFAEGKADPANTGEITKQDVTVGTGVVGTIIGVVSMGSGSVVVEGMNYLGILNSIDDIGTNKNGESFIEQHFNDIQAKNVVHYTKNAVSITNATVNTVNIISNPIGEETTIESGASLLNYVVNWLNEKNPK